MAASVGHPPGTSVLLATALTIAACLLLIGWFGVLLPLIATLAALPLCLLAQRKIHGYTGDILGGSQQLAEVATLVALAALI